MALATRTDRTGPSDRHAARPAVGLDRRQEGGHGRQRPDHAAVPGRPHARQPQDLLRAGRVQRLRATGCAPSASRVLHYEWVPVDRPRRCCSPPSSRTPSPRTSSAAATSGPARSGTCTSGARASYATRTMRWGGVILGLFIVWHILDLTTLHRQRATPSPAIRTRTSWRPSPPGTATSSTSSRCSPLGLHVRHGFWSAAQTLGVGSATRDRALKTVANVLALRADRSASSPYPSPS